MDGKSLNLTQELLQQLQTLIPQAFSEGKLDTTALKTLLGEDVFVQGERYGLSWAGKSDAYKVLQQQTTTTLIPEPEQSVDWDNAQHVFIEGENLEVLKLLQKSYFGQVKMIYIDPPYNTGSDSFIYPDKFSETKEEYLQRIGDKNDEGYMLRQGAFRPNRKESGQYHSNWLNMMLPRLFLAWNLLRDDGVIVVHIDEHEYSNLEKILEELFGEENFLGTIVWDKRNPKGDAKGISYQHEYIIFYAKNKDIFSDKCSFVRPKTNAERMLKKVEALIKKNGLTEETRREYKNWIKTQVDLSGGERAYSLIDDNGDIYQPVSMAWPNKQLAPDDYLIPLIHPVSKKPCPMPARGWRNPSSTMNELLAKNLIIFGDDEKTQPRRKYLLKENLDENIPSLLYFGGSDDALLDEFGLSFDNPKVVNVSKQLIYPIVQKSEIIVDFFAGSGTTAQAVMELNEEDGGNRRYICVQLPEKTEEGKEAAQAGYATIADITAARIKKVIEKIQLARPKENAGADYRLGFRKFTLAPSNFKLWRGDVIESEEELLRQMRLFATPQRATATTPDMAWELLLKSGLSLTDKVVVLELADGLKVYHTADKSLALVLDGFNSAVQTAVLTLKPKQLIVLDSVFAGQANGDSLKTNAQLTFEDQGIAFKTV